MTIKIYTEDWEGNKILLDALLYCKVHSSKRNAFHNLFSVRAKDGALAVAVFFRNCAKHAKKKQAKIYIESDYNKYCQFFGAVAGEEFAIKWFFIECENYVLYHDIAFETTLLTKYKKENFLSGKKHGYRYPLGTFKNKRGFYREFAIKNQAYKLIANFVLKNN